MEIIKATVKNIDQIAPLFDAYRQFYQQPADLEGASDYIHARLYNHESIIFLALSDQHEPIGFTQLYRAFCSVEMIKTLTLYDLFVADDFRGEGVGRALLNQAKTEAANSNVSRIDLQTAHTNLSAQRLYKSFGYQMSDEFQNWSFYLSD